MDYEAEYNNRGRVPEHPAIFARWAEASAAFRGMVAAADLGVPYGPSPRQILDIVWPAPDRQAPVVLFIHGGYWRSLHPRDFTFTASALLSQGVALALAGYDLAPHVAMGTILDQARLAAITLHRLMRRPVPVAGHSAGAHLAAALTATRWRKIAADLPDDMVPAGLGISGVYDLAPLVSLSVNEVLGLDEAEARRLSPALWPVPRGRSFDVYVGGTESAEFLRQSRDLAAAWRAQGIAAPYCEVAGANHFTVVDALSDPASSMVGRLVEMARASVG